MGGHGTDGFTPPRFTTISGYSRPLRLSLKEKLDAIIERTRKGGGEIVIFSNR